MKSMFKIVCGPLLAAFLFVPFSGCSGGSSSDDSGSGGQSTSLRPVAEAGGPYSGAVDTPVSLDGRGSSDSDGWITAYAWDLDHDGQYDDADGDIVDFSAASAGTYTICLQVTDNDGLADTTTTTVTVSGEATASVTYPIVDTGQTGFHDDVGAIAAPSRGDAFYGQDAQYSGNPPSYAISADGLTVYDAVTGLTWMRDADLDGDGDIDADDKRTYAAAREYPETLNAQNFGGYSDWRVPTIKELYSLINFQGTDPPPEGASSAGQTPYIDADTFRFAYGDTNAGERIIESQWVTGTLYVGTVFDGVQAMFGVNFADGRIKGYPAPGGPGGIDKTYYVRLCRGNPEYGVNAFVDNGDGTITDSATALMWSREDSGFGMDWQAALAWAEEMNDQNHLGYSDWRLPNAKELQSIVDYTRSPDTTGSAAIDPLFGATRITNVAGEPDYPFYWTGTTHLGGNTMGDNGGSAVYVAFGRGLGSMDGFNVIDVHGAGCQRSDPKTGDPDDYPAWGFGPQGDLQRVFNYVRLVRNADSEI